MNKRIKELAEQAGFKNYDGTSLYSPYIEGMELNDELQEFAKLILAEVQKVYDDNRLDDDYEIYAFLNVVKEHFGVE